MCRAGLCSPPSLPDSWVPCLVPLPRPTRLAVGVGQWDGFLALGHGGLLGTVALGARGFLGASCEGMRG